MGEEIKDRIKDQIKIFSKKAESFFGPYFAERVMDRIEEIEKSKKKGLVFYESVKSVFRKIAVVSVILLLILISYNVRIGDFFSEEEAIFISEAVYNDLENLPLF